MSTIAGIVYTIIRIETFLILIRVLLSWFPGIPPWHPLVRALAAVVDPVLMPLRRILPSVGGIDFSPIVAIVLLDQLATVAGDIAAQVYPSVSFLIVSVVARIILDVLLVLIIIVLLRVVVSFFNASPFNPFVRLIQDLSSPLVRPFAGMAAARSRSADVPAIVALIAYVVLYIVAQRLLGLAVDSTLPSHTVIT